MLGCIEREVCNILYMHPNQKLKIRDCHVKKGPPMEIAADSESINVLLESATENGFMEKLFVNKPVEIGYNKFKKNYVMMT